MWLLSAVKQALFNNFQSVICRQLWFAVMEALSLCWCCWNVCVFLYQSGFLRDHVGDAIDNGISDSKIFIDQLIGIGIVPKWLLRQRTHQELEQGGVKGLLHVVLHVRKAPDRHGGRIYLRY